MEEEKAAAYYDELTRKGEGAARFKQGLGFSASSSNDDVPKPGSALPSSSSFLSKFVKASSPSNSKASEVEKQAQLQSIQNRLKKKPPTSPSRVSENRERDSDRSRRRSRSRERHRERDRDLRRRSRSRSRSRERYRHRDRRRRSRSRSRERGRRRSRSASPRQRRSSDKEKRSGRSDVGDNRGKVSETGKGNDARVDYGKLIEGYDSMSSAERVKAKMKLQLSETAKQDSEKGVGWERFEFNKDAPLDDEEIEVAEDDASLVKHIGQSFRFSAIEARRGEQIQAAHEEAIFGASSLPPSISTDSEPERENEKEVDRKDLVTSLLSDTVLAKRKGSWRDRVREA